MKPLSCLISWHVAALLFGGPHPGSFPCKVRACVCVCTCTHVFAEEGGANQTHPWGTGLEAFPI